MKFPKTARAITILVLCLSALTGLGCGGGRGEAESSSTAALGEYRSGLEEDAKALVAWMAWMEKELKRGRTTAAQSRYAAARVPFGHLKPFLIGFPNLNVRLDGQWDERPEKQLTGFHEIERLLWTDHPMKMRLAAVKKLSLDAKRLQDEVKTSELEPDGIARRINEVLSGAVLLALAGDEEPVAHIDMVDLSADIEGVEAAFKAIEPLLLERRPELANQIRGRFEHFYREIAPLGIPAREPEQPRPIAPGVSFVVYTEDRRSDLQKLQLVLDELNKPFSEVPAALTEPPTD
ncbi:MAG TPA: EfeM/EfeO family lipoprotein [Solirubrobacterales bacterium]|nr:EfeM/EfeO family lipoprotein [Solirubrobacterales bacterium]